ncbi:Hypothetical predicted protein [Octopus vulgaris]|uniref:Uncharacterized protein n=1 Tax=Octopus vulgaris TaxID=6645 RepID=A0AA36BJ10_OCTVU|nr:Hypothetical predicted protein [Octopus vulgaris]
MVVVCHGCGGGGVVAAAVVVISGVCGDGCGGGVVVKDRGSCGGSGGRTSILRNSRICSSQQWFKRNINHNDLTLTILG